MTQVSVCQSQSKLSQNSQFNLVLLLQTDVLGGNKMKLLQNNVLRGNELNCFKAT